jgi:hypothetical protein
MEVSNYLQDQTALILEHVTESLCGTHSWSGRGKEKK